LEKNMPRLCIVLVASALVISLAAPAAWAQAGTPPAGYKAEILRSVEDVEKKLTALAEKFPADKYTWHPEGARSPGELFTHVAAGNYTFATFLGVPRPEGMTRESLAKITDKAAIIEALRKSFAHVEAAVQNAGDLDKPVKIFGRDGTIREVMLIVATHNHEHLGQAIAYARMNGIVPPWSEEQAKPPAAKPAK
jgi:uncharacterized damage-inducible protein DinB